MAISQEKRARIYERDGNACLRCESTDDLTLDHIYPRAYGGSDNDGNLQTLCAPCNQAKADTLPDDSQLTKRQRKKLGKPRPYDKPRLRLGAPQTFASIGIRIHHRDCHPVWGCSMHCPVDGAMGKCIA